MWLYVDGQPPNLVWDRKVEGGFPELKVLVRSNSVHVRRFASLRAPVSISQKQRIRDRIQPGKSLGHSDKHVEQQQ